MPLKFTRAIVRKPCRNMVLGLTSADLGVPDFDLAVLQHQQYIAALKKCGLDVIVLEADENYPDSVFMEDVALLTPEVAVITNPGAESRKGEINGVKHVLDHYFDHVESIDAPGTVEAGDIMMAGAHFYIGLSARTNKAGASQMTALLNRYGMTASTVPLKEMLHLKTGLSYLENNNLLVTGEFLDNPEFTKFNVVPVPSREAYAANSVWINGHVLVPEGFPETQIQIEKLGYDVIPVQVSEFRKLDGGLSCLSLRF